MSPAQLLKGDTKIKSWYDGLFKSCFYGLFKSGHAMSATTGLIGTFPYSAEQRGMLMDHIAKPLEHAHPR
jgi:hypothetical protein